MYYAVSCNGHGFHIVVLQNTTAKYGHEVEKLVMFLLNSTHGVYMLLLYCTMLIKPPKSQSDQIWPSRFGEILNYNPFLITKKIVKSLVG